MIFPLRPGSHLCNFKCIFSFVEMHYSPFNMITYGSSSHLCVFHRCTFGKDRAFFFPAAGCSIDFNGNTAKMHQKCSACVFDAFLLHFCWIFLQDNRHQKMHVKNAPGKSINHNLHRCEPGSSITKDVYYGLLSMSSQSSINKMKTGCCTTQ